MDAPTSVMENPVDQTNVPTLPETEGDINTINEFRQIDQWDIEADEHLLSYLKGFSSRFMQKMESVRNQIEELVHETKTTEVHVYNTFNEFMMLCNTQFIENRVDEEDPPQPQPEKTQTVPSEEDIKKNYLEAINLGISALDSCNVPLEDSDDELDDDEEDDDEEEPKQNGETQPTQTVSKQNLIPHFAQRALPFVIGTKEFFEDEHCGIKPEEDDIEEEPMDAPPMSQDMSVDPNVPPPPPPPPGMPEETNQVDRSQDVENMFGIPTEQIKIDENETTEGKKEEENAPLSAFAAIIQGKNPLEGGLFGSETTKRKDDDEEFDLNQLENEMGLNEGNKKKETNEFTFDFGNDGLFGSEEKEDEFEKLLRGDDEKKDSLFLEDEDEKKEEKKKEKKKKEKKEDDLFGDEEDNFLFGDDLPKKAPEKKKEKKTEKKEETKKSLFDFDLDEEDDLLNDILDKPKKKKEKKEEVKKEEPKEKEEEETFKDDSEEETKPKDKKSLEQVFLGGLQHLAKEKNYVRRKKVEAPVKKDDSPSKDVEEPKESDDFFADFMKQDKKSEPKKEEKKETKAENKKSGGLFDDTLDDFDEVKPKPKEPAKAKKYTDLFASDDDEFDVFDTKPKKEEKKVKQETKKVSLFGDLSDDEEEKQKVEKKETPKQEVKKEASSDFFAEFMAESEQQEKKPEPKKEKPKTEKKSTPKKSNLFADLSDEEEPIVKKEKKKVEPKKSNLFGDLDDTLDLNEPKEEEKRPKDELVEKARANLFADKSIKTGKGKLDKNSDFIKSLASGGLGMFGTAPPPLGKPMKIRRPSVRTEETPVVSEKEKVEKTERKTSLFGDIISESPEKRSPIKNKEEPELNRAKTNVTNTARDGTGQGKKLEHVSLSRPKMRGRKRPTRRTPVRKQILEAEKTREAEQTVDVPDINSIPESVPTKEKKSLFEEEPKPIKKKKPTSLFGDALVGELKQRMESPKAGSPKTGSPKTETSKTKKQTSLFGDEPIIEQKEKKVPSKIAKKQTSLFGDEPIIEQKKEEKVPSKNEKKQTSLFDEPITKQKTEEKVVPKVESKKETPKSEPKKEEKKNIDDGFFDFDLVTRKAPKKKKEKKTTKNLTFDNDMFEDKPKKQAPTQTALEKPSKKESPKQKKKLDTTNFFDDVVSAPKKSTKKETESKKKSLFEDFDVPPKSKKKEERSENKKSANDIVDDLLSSIDTKKTPSTKQKKKTSLFDDPLITNQEAKKSEKKKVTNFFSDEDFGITKKTEKKKKTPQKSLFDF